MERGRVSMRETVGDLCSGLSALAVAQVVAWCWQRQWRAGLLYDEARVTRRTDREVFPGARGAVLGDNREANACQEGEADRVPCVSVCMHLHETRWIAICHLATSRLWPVTDHPLVFLCSRVRMEIQIPKPAAYRMRRCPCMCFLTLRLTHKKEKKNPQSLTKAHVRKST